MPLIKHLDEITRKLQMVEEDIASIQGKGEILQGTVGGSEFAEQLSFALSRRDLLQWCLNASVGQIAERLASLHEEMGVTVKLKYGDMRGVPRSVVLNVAHAELLELALGIHPCQQPRAN